MNRKVKNSLLALLLSATSAMAQDAPKESPAPAATTPAASGNTCQMGHCCHMMMTAPRKGFHHSIEWGGVYGGPSNQVSYRMFGHTFHQDMRDRDAVRMNAGYQFNPYLYVGGGVGAEFQYQAFTNLTSNDHMPPTIPTVAYTGTLVVVPIYAEIKGYLLKKPISPFLSLRSGYAPAIYNGEGKHTAESTAYNNISVGVRIYSHLSITAGYLFMYQPVSVSGYDQNNNNNVLLDRSNPYQHRFTVGIAIGM